MAASLFLAPPPTASLFHCHRPLLHPALSTKPQTLQASRRVFDYATHQVPFPPSFRFRGTSDEEKWCPLRIVVWFLEVGCGKGAYMGVNSLARKRRRSRGLAGGAAAVAGRCGSTRMRRARGRTMRMIGVWTFLWGLYRMFSGRCRGGRGGLCVPFSPFPSLPNWFVIACSISLLFIFNLHCAWFLYDFVRWFRFKFDNYVGSEVKL